jgi:cell division protein FtsL
MGAINLLPKRNIEKKYGPLQKNVYLLTSVVLTMYIVAASAILGLKIYLNQRSHNLDQEIQKLNSQIREQSSKEALVLELFNRSAKGREFVDTRPPVQSYSDILKSEEVIIEGWTYGVGQPQTLSVVSGSAESIERFADVLKQKYSSITIDKLTHNLVDNVWSGELLLL